MSKLVKFRSKTTGAVCLYPEHYGTRGFLKDDLVRVDDSVPVVEKDKVDISDLTQTVLAEPKPKKRDK